MKAARVSSLWAALLLAVVVCAQTGGTEAGMTGSPALQPFTMDHRGGLGGHSPADVSFLLDPPAGKYGFLHERNGHLANGEGRRVRFWGVNITDWSPGSTMIPPRRDAHLWAATLARFGVNCVRLQFLDLLAPRGLIAAGRSGTREFDPEQLDREDYFLAALEQEGIYIDLNLLVGRPFKAGDGVADADKLGQGAKGTSLFDPTLIALQKEYARKLLTHVNPYTKRAYRDDPAVAIVEINNENAIGAGFRAPSPYYSRELDAIYNRWLKKHAGKEAVHGLHRAAGTMGDEPIPLLSRQEVAGAPPLRFATESRFYLWLESGYFDSMRNYLRENLGVKCVILATADHNHESTGYPLELALHGFDAMDGHDYWEGPWERRAKSAMVNDPLHSTPVQLSRSAVAGDAYTVSEVNEPFPNDDGAEQIPILAAYGGLQDWDAILWYTFEPKKDPYWLPYVGDPFDLSLDPVKMTELAAGALTFLRGDVAPARATVLRSYSVAQVFDSTRLPATGSPYFTPGFPLWIPLEHGSRIASLNGVPTAGFEKKPRPDPIPADTGQLIWDVSGGGRGSITVDSPRTQARIGFDTTEGKMPANLSVQISNPFSAIVLTSLDGEPIARSTRMLLITAARVANTGMEWNQGHTGLAQWGGPPTLIEPVSGHIELRGLFPAMAVMAQPLNGAGLPLGAPLQGTRDGDTWSIAVGEPATPWYVLTVQYRLRGHTIR
jgi:hypothetical protein